MNTTHEIPNFIHYLAVLTILFSLLSVEAEKHVQPINNCWKEITYSDVPLLFKCINKDTVRHDSNSFDEITQTVVDTWRNTKPNIL